MLRRPTILSAALVAAALALLAPAPGASARDALVPSFDGTFILTHFYPSDTGRRAPTVLVGARFGFPGDTNPDGNTSDVIGASVLRAAGYNVLTWDPRGFGGSGGTSGFDSPGVEGRDIRALVSYVARQPEAKRDRRGDPRIGMSGSSYGGGIQLGAAALDHRIDAIVPDIGWYFLPQGLFPLGAVKALFPFFCRLSEGGPLPEGVPVPPRAVHGRMDSHWVSACASAIADGTVSGRDRLWFADRGPGSSVARVRAPTLLLQGTVDVLFGPSHTVRSYKLLRRHHVPVKMVWYCGGHGTCKTGGNDPDRLRQIALRWLNRWLKHDRIRTGPRFEWVGDDGLWRSARDYPLASDGTVQATGFGTLPVRDNPGRGAPAVAAPALDAVSAPFPAAIGGGEILGAPTVHLRYSGTASPPRTFLFAQVVDRTRKLVIGSQVTAIPVVLDGAQHETTVPLEVIASHMDSLSDYALEITSSSTVFTPQRSRGTIGDLTVEATMPLVRGVSVEEPIEP